MAEKAVRRKRKKKSGDRDIIVLDHVSKSYETGSPALNDINLRIRRGEFVFIVGDSGSGKSTMIKLLLRELTATEGNVKVLGYDLNRIRHRKIPEFRRNIGIVFQDFRLIPKMSVYDNVAFAMRVIGAKEKEIRKRVPYILQLVGLSHKARSMPNELSGGEQQRVSLARALVNNPKLIVADEPTGNVDPEMNHEIVDMLTKINNNGTTVIMVTHEHDLVRAFQRRVIVIKNGEVVSDTPDPTHAQFDSEETEKSTDMFFYNEDIKLGEEVEDIFDSIDDFGTKTTSETNADIKNGGEE